MSQSRLRHLASAAMSRFYWLRRRVDTDDLLHDALIKLEASLEEADFASLRSYFALAAKIIRCHAIDLVRKMKNEPLATLDEINRNGSVPMAIEVADKHPSPGSVVCSSEAWERFQIEVDELPYSLREVFDLIWIMRLSKRDAAKVLELNERTVFTRWLKVKSRLGEALRNLELVH